jgi:hypothetical protein
MNGQLNVPNALSPEENPQYPFDRRWEGPRTGLDAMEKRIGLALVQYRTPPVQSVTRHYTVCGNPAVLSIYMNVSFPFYYFLVSPADLTKNILRYNYTFYFTIWPVYTVATDC